MVSQLSHPELGANTAVSPKEPPDAVFDDEP